MSDPHSGSREPGRGSPAPASSWTVVVGIAVFAALSSRSRCAWSSPARLLHGDRTLRRLQRALPARRRELRGGDRHRAGVADAATVLARARALRCATLQFALHSLNHLFDIGRAHPLWTGYFDFFSLAPRPSLLAWLWRRREPRRQPTPTGAPPARTRIEPHRRRLRAQASPLVRLIYRLVAPRARAR